MYAIRKKDLKAFTPDAESVCRIEEGNTNPYLKDARVIEEFLKTVEPAYNSAVEKLLTDKIDGDCIYVIAGFAAYILTCSPTAMRLHSAPMKHMIEETGRALDSVLLRPELDKRRTSVSMNRRKAESHGRAA